MHKAAAPIASRATVGDLKQDDCFPRTCHGVPGTGAYLWRCASKIYPVRDDKAAEQATSVEEIYDMYRRGKNDWSIRRLQVAASELICINSFGGAVSR
jgi:hypothetical protein